MATAATVKGKSMKLKLATIVILNLKSNSLSHMAEVIETSTKDSGDYKEYIASWKDMTFDAEGLANAVAGAMGIEDLHAAVGTIVAYEYGDDVAGHRKITGNAILLNVDEDAPDDDVVGFTLSLQNTGDPVFGTYAP